MKSGILYEFNNNYNYSNEKELYNKEQIIVNWLNTIKEPHCLLINKLDEKYILNGDIFIEILKVFLKKFDAYSFKPDTNLNNIDKFKLLCALLIKIEKDKNKINSLYYFYNYNDIIYKDKNILINFFILLKESYERYIYNKNKSSLNKSFTVKDLNNTKKQKKINNNETVEILHINTLFKNKNKNHTRNYTNHSNSNNILFSFNTFSNARTRIKNQIIQNSKTVEDYKEIKKVDFSNNFGKYKTIKDNIKNKYNRNNISKYLFCKTNSNSKIFNNKIGKYNYLTNNFSIDKNEKFCSKNNGIKNKYLFLNKNNLNINTKYQNFFKTIPIKKKTQQIIRIKKDSKYLKNININKYFNTKQKELKMNYTQLFNHSKTNPCINKSDDIMKNKNLYLQIKNIKQIFKNNIKGININDKKRKIKEIIQWVNKINPKYIIQNEIILINKVSKGVLLCHILSSIKLLLGQNIIQNIINYPSNLLQIKHNFSLFWKEINNIPDMKLILMKYKINEMDIINKKENILLELLIDLFNYYNKINNCVKKENEKQLNKTSIQHNIIKSINKYSKYKYYDKFKFDRKKRNYNNYNFILINSYNNNSFNCHRVELNNKNNKIFNI